MKKLIFCFSLVCAGLMPSCIDKNELVDEDSRPEWLGASIYDELQSKSSRLLQGDFTTYLRLIDDLGYTETMKRTGSKTIFPANDEAFAKFFASEPWPGVHSYGDLSAAQKKLLLYSSMLDNALLVNMLSNASSTSSVEPGMAVKHLSALNAIDTITHYTLPYADSFKGNKYWTRFDKKGGVDVVSDATTQMIVHFTRDYMLNNGITTTGENSDFSLITGGEYTGSDAYIFDKKIIVPDVTCQNGYIHQVDDVVVSPGNMAQMLKKMDRCSIFSHMLDRFAVPVYNSEVTNRFHDWYHEQEAAGNNMSGIINPDSIFEVRYLSSLSKGALSFVQDPDGRPVAANWLLTFDPGWNEYYRSAASNTTVETVLNEIGAMFVPTDEAMKDYFVRGGGKPILDRYKFKENTDENVIENVDSIPMNVTAALLSNLMKVSFADNVPSKFPSMIDDAADHMDMELSYISKKADGKFDINIANNGVIYVLDKVVGPKRYVAVSAPTMFSTDLKVIDWIISNRSVTADNKDNPFSLDLDFYAYLLAMSANYALFMPNDGAFDYYYVDPASLAYDEDENGNKTYLNTPKVMHYYPLEKSPFIGASVFRYNPETHEVGDSIGELNLSNSGNMAIVKAQLADIINYHTVVLNTGDRLGSNTYYKTKHGGEIMVTGGSMEDDQLGAKIMSGSQIDNGVAPSVIKTPYDMENGHTYIIDRLIQGPRNSVYSFLRHTPEFKMFYELCNGFVPEVLEWAGISSNPDPETQIRPIDRYKVFFRPGEYEDTESKKDRCIDNNIKMFNSYNYTVYVPNNEAMEEAYRNGLPTWDDINRLYEIDEENTGQGMPSDEKAKARAYEMIDAIRRFVRYHFHNNSVYADNTVEGGNFSTFLTDSNDRNMTINVDGGNGRLLVTDASGTTHTISAGGNNVNKMAREFDFDKNASEATYMKSSSFAAIHEISQPLYYNVEKSFGVNAKVNAKQNKGFRK